MTSNGNVYPALTAGKSFTGATTLTPWRVVSGFSEVQSSRLKLSLPLPSVLKSHFKLVDGPPSSAIGNTGFNTRIRIYIGSGSGSGSDEKCTEHDVEQKVDNIA